MILDIRIVNVGTLMVKKENKSNEKNILVSIHVLSFCAWFGATLYLILLGFYL